MHNTPLITASPQEEEITTRSGRVSRPPARLIKELEDLRDTSRKPRSQSRHEGSAPHAPRKSSALSRSPAISIYSRPPSAEPHILYGIEKKAYTKYIQLKDERSVLILRLQTKWAEAIQDELASRIETAKQKAEEASAIIETLEAVDEELEEATLEKDQAALNLANYEAKESTDPKDEKEHLHRAQYYEQKISAYNDGEYGHQKETEELIDTLIRERESY